MFVKNIVNDKHEFFKTYIWVVLSCHWPVYWFEISNKIVTMKLWKVSFWRVFTSFFTNVSLKRFSVIVNCGNCSDIEVVRLPEVYTFSSELIKIFFISVEEVPVILFGKLTGGVKLFEKTDFKNS